MALRLFAAEQADCGEVARIFMVRVEALLAAAHAGVVGDVPESDEYQREVQAYLMAFGGYSKQLLKRLSAGGGEGERGGANARRDLGTGGGGWFGSDGHYSRGFGGGSGAGWSGGDGHLSRGSGVGGGVGRSASGPTGAPSGGAFGGVAASTGGGVAGQRRRQRERRKGRSFASGSVLCLLAARALPLLPGARLLRPCARVGFRKGSLPGAVSGGRVHA